MSVALVENGTRFTHVASRSVNSRDKVIDLKEFEVTGIEKKVELLLDASGAKIKHIKGSRVVESTTEAARGIWSGLHVDTPFKI